MAFDPEFRRHLEALRLAVRRALAGRREGERSGRRKGGGQAFHSYRSYAPGDDFRSIDWNLYARLGDLLVRERTREEAPELDLVVDSSPSMEFGTPTKLDLARRLAAVFGWLALSEGGNVRLDGRDFRGDPAGGGFLEAVERAGVASVGNAVRAIRRPALVTVFSDFWDEGIGDLLSPVAASSQGLTLVQLLSREELDPPARGLLRFVDSESGAAVDRHVGPEELAEYSRAMEEGTRAWRDWARKREAGYLRCATDEPFDRIVMLHLRGEGLIE